MPWFSLTGDARIHKQCATENCAGQPTFRLESGGVGSVYCSGCHVNIEANATAGEWTEGVCDDGAAILFDGLSVPISDLLSHLNRTAVLQRVVDILERENTDLKDVLHQIGIMATQSPRHHPQPDRNAVVDNGHEGQDQNQHRHGLAPV